MSDSASSAADFLVEIGTEELPPKSLRSLQAAFQAALSGGLESASLEFADVQSFATPRRLAVLVQGLSTVQPDQRIERRGPPVAVAFDGDGQPTRAAEAFAESCGAAIDDLGRETTPKGEWLSYTGVQSGDPATVLLPDIVKQALGVLPIARRMRWGSGDAEFVRPVHWIVMLLGHDVVDAMLFGVASGRDSYGHRFHSAGPIPIPAPEAYAGLLERDGFVLADFDARRERIELLVRDAAEALDGEPVLDPDLLDEVTALVEWPVAVTGAFEESFLELPEEVLIATLQVHQRYFPVREHDGSLGARFITISNIDSTQPDEVRRGNERVVRPRLADAAFFHDQDRRQSLDSRRKGLSKVVYQRGLGTLADKVDRVVDLAAIVAPLTGADKKAAVRAAALCRSDLLTDMVGEFPELQGTIGTYYARDDGEPEDVAVALEEMYRPAQRNDALPASPVGQALAIADRLDTLAGIFALGKSPSGNRDPFGLRRAALGIVRILVENEIDADLPALYRAAVDLQPVDDIDAAAITGELVSFTFQRMRAWYRDADRAANASRITPEMFESVLARTPVSPLDFHQRILAVREFVDLPEATALASANKRIGNILKSAESVPAGGAAADLLQEPSERSLFDAIESLRSDHERDRADRSYTAMLRRLSALRQPVDLFFDDVMVMAEDPAVRDNRLALLSSIHALFLDVADLSCLPAP